MTAKIIFLGPVPPPYMGPSLATEIILGSALKDRFRLIHLDTSDHRDLSALGAIDFGNVYLALKHYCLLLWYLARYWPEIVYIPISQTTIGYLRDSVFILLAKLLGRKVVCHLRGGNFRNWFNGSGVITRGYVRLVHRFVDAQIVLGKKLKPLFQGILPEDRLFVVPNGRDFTETPGDLSGDDANHKFRVLYLSNFALSKGVMDVLKSVPLVCRIRRDVEFFLAGDCKDESLMCEIKEFIAAHGNSGCSIRLAGKVSGKAKYDLFKQADIFVFPTYYPPEGHPWVIVEALAAGMPIISTDQGAITESVFDGLNGFIVEKQSPEGIAEKILALCGDDEIRTRMAIESRKLYEKEFTERQLVERIANVFNSVLNRESPGK